MKENLLPFFNERKHPVTMLVLHSFASEDFIASCHQHRVSAHYTMELNGTITCHIKEKNRAWHAGIGSWREFKEDINSSSIGIEIKNKTLGQTPFSKKQIEKLIPFLQTIIKKYKIKPENIVAHSDIAPSRKADPGHKFPWKLLAQNGIGLWYDKRKLSKETDIKKLLSAIGYNTENLEAAAYAFCRRFLPEYVKTEKNIGHLVDNVLPNNYAFIKKENFIKTLRATAYAYNK